MTLAESIDRVHVYWARQLAITPAMLLSSQLSLVPHPEASTGSYIMVFQHRSFTCLRVPSSQYNAIAYAIRQPDAAPLSPKWWQQLLNDSFAEAIGPAYLGYADSTDFRPTESSSIRLLTPEDDPALRAFAVAVGSVAWEHSGLGDEPQPIVGYWDTNRLVAAAGYTVWGEALAHIGVTTHPAFRGHGYGRAVVSGIGQHALAHGYVLQYRTLLANTPSLAIAAALGFQAYGTSLFITQNR
jgi:GNAT superfamily N-acetyltransferase